MSVTSQQLVVRYQAAENDNALSGVSAVGLPPSDADPAVGSMRVVVAGQIITRYYDSTVGVA